MNVLSDVKQIISKQVGLPVEQLGPDSNLEAIGVESWQSVVTPWPPAPRS